MKGQRSLFDPAESPPPAARHRRTSVAAAESVRPTRMSRQARVLACIQESPKTDQEVAEALGLPENSVRPRRVELEQQQLVRESGKTRQTASGRRAIVWESTPVEPSPPTESSQ